MYIYQARVLKIVDGDTIDVDLDLGLDVHLHARLRLSGIDTPELNSSDPAIRERAKEAKECLINMLTNQDVVVHTKKGDKYGRYLAEVFLNGTSVNQLLVESGLAVPYT